MVVFTLTGLDTNVQLTEHPEYPQYTAPSITASYFLDLSMNTVDLSGVFFFSTTHPDESTLIFPVYVLDFSNDYGKTTNVPLLNYSQADSKISFNTSDTILFNGETPSGYDDSAYYWQDISNSIISDPYSYLYGAFAFTNSTNTGTGYIEYTLNTTSTNGGYVELKIKPNNRARKYFNVDSSNNTIELEIVTTSNYSGVAENPIPINTTQTFTIPEKNYSVLQLEEVINSLLSSNYISAVYNEQSNKFTFSRLNYDFQIGGTAKEWLGFSSSTSTNNISSNGLLVSNTEILDSAGSISIYVDNSLQTARSNNLNMATGTKPLVYRYSFNDGDKLKIESNNLGGFAIYWVKIIHSNIVDNADMAFRAESSYWPDISFSEGIISDCVKSDILTYSVPKTTKTIGPAWLAKNITGGYNNSDIFSNENDLVQNYVDLDKNPPNYVFPVGSYEYYRLLVYRLNVSSTFSERSPEASNVSATGYGWRASAAEIKVFSDVNRESQLPVSGFSSSSGEWPAAWAFNNDITSTTEPGWLTKVTYDENGIHQGEASINGIKGEWIQWKLGSSTTLTGISYSTNAKHAHSNSNPSGYHSIDASEVIIFGSNDNSNWTQLVNWKDNFTRGQYSTLYFMNESEFKIKDQIVSKINNAGTIENPLSNINNDVTNVSREIVNSMLDSSDPEVVQRVHTMIENNQIAYPYQTHNVTINDSSNCVIDGEINPTITLVRGLTYDFILNNSDTSSEPPIYNDGSLNTIFRDNKFLLSLYTIDYTSKIDTSTISFAYNNSGGVLNFTNEVATIPPSNEEQTYVFHNIQFNEPNRYQWLIRLGAGLSSGQFRLTAGYRQPSGIFNNLGYYAVETYKNNISNSEVFGTITTSNLHTLVVSYNGIDKLKLIKIEGTSFIEEVKTFTVNNDENPGESHIFGYHKDYIGDAFSGAYRNFAGSADNFIYYNTYITDTQVLINSIKLLDVESTTSFTPDLPVENISDMYYQDGLSFYLNANTTHTSDDDYTQVTMPLFYSDVSYSTTDGYPITWENSNYRKIRFTVPFDAPDTLSIISQDSSNNNFSGQINIITNTYLPWIPITFGHNDVLQFRLTYKADLITDSNGVALDSTGVKLGTNSVENQDYVARLTLKIPEIVYDFTNHADNTAAFSYLNSTDLSHNLSTVAVDNPNNYSVENSNGIVYWNGSEIIGYIEIINFPGNSGTVTIKYGSNDTVGNGDKTSYILITDNVNNSTRVHEISPTSGNAFNVIHTAIVPYNKTTKSIKIIEQWSAVTLEKITIQQIF